jgi:hypothetical protein
MITKNEILNYAISKRADGATFAEIYRDLLSKNEMPWSCYQSFYSCFKEHEVKVKYQQNLTVISDEDDSIVKNHSRLKIKTETVYRASDNTPFVNRSDAELHELSLVLKKQFVQKGISDVKGACMYLSNNLETFTPLLTRIKKAKNRKVKKETV